MDQNVVSYSNCEEGLTEVTIWFYSFHQIFGLESLSLQYFSFLIDYRVAACGLRLH